ncbi:MBL fold metallo-hydrolase [Roseateles sp. DB2]|uniref:MBL fold metallo-hydrolase n=1 Tax=Roseateles sp. DB2 TaxID=3453717 RepID=UPI003EEC6D4A
MPPYLLSLGPGLYRIDTAFQRDDFDAAYLIVDQGRAAFVDTGTNHAVPRLLGALAHLGLAPEAVDWVIPTHVHLDHAGGVGLLMQSLPQARLLAHPRGLRHLVDPRALWAGALAVYGEQEMLRSYGQLQAVPAERAEASEDGQRLRVGSRELLLIDTPGHARHHHCLFDAQSGCWFTGDTFGLSYREFDVDGRPWLFPTSTPVQFDPPALKQSMQRMLDLQPQGMLLTHFGRIGHSAAEVSAMHLRLLELLDETVALSQALHGAENRHEALKAALSDLYLRSLAAHGCPLPPERQLALLAMDIELNAQGIGVWLDKPAA